MRGKVLKLKEVIAGLLLLTILSSVQLHCGERQASGRKHEMTLSNAANRWDYAMPTGNGQVGAMVFGNVQTETVILTHDALLMRSQKPTLPDVSEHVPKLRSMIAEGRYKEAEIFFGNKIDEKYDCRYPDSFHPALNINVDMQTAGEVGDERRTVNFETGEVTVAWTQGGVGYERKLFVSRKDDVVVMQIRSSKPGAVNCRTGLLPVGLKRDELGDGKNVRVPRFPASRFKAKIMLKEVPITFNLSAENGGLKLLAEYDVGGSHQFVGGEYGGAARVIVKGGKKTVSNLQVVAEDADEVLVLLKLFANEKGATAMRRTTDEIDALPDDYDALLKRHAALHGELFLRARVDLDADDKFRSLTNEELIEQVAEGRGLNAMMERLFDVGRYGLICSSRPGAMPAHLQGIWIGEYAPAWAADYHNDLNIEMNYYQALTGNMAETALPYFDYYDSMLDDYRTNARNLYGCRGIMAPGCQTTHGLMYRSQLFSWTAGAGWLAQLYYDYWLFTGDREFLEKRAVPFLREVALFYEDFLFEGKDGKYIFSPSNSPENRPSNARSVVTVNATMDIAVAREVLGNLCAACELLGIEQEGVKRWRKMLTKLPEYMVNKEGAVKEWSDSRFEDNFGHRHLSHLYPVFPGLEITAERNPRLMKAFRTALDKKVAKFGPLSWSYAQIASTRARMEDASGAYDSLEAIARGYILPNFFTLLQHGRPLLQFEATSAIPAAVVEMLVVSEPGMIKLLPALPKKWPVGKAEGIACRGGVEVSLKWNMNEKRIDAAFISRTAQKVTVKFPAPVASIEIDSAEAKIAASRYGDAYRLLTLPAKKRVAVTVTFE